jgi:hypothetical protein
MKQLLIISPLFPPVNAADMHRVRQMLPYLEQFGWQATVVAVRPENTEMVQDPLLLHTLPSETEVIHVPAWPVSLTRKLGLGSVALRSMRAYDAAVSQLLKKRHFDLAFFSTTQFPVCVLGAKWKKKFGLPYVIDIQDAWHTDYYLHRPKHERPAKFWFSYRLNKYTEPIALRQADGLVAVSEGYITDLQARYPENIKLKNALTAPFGAFPGDTEILRIHPQQNPFFDPSDGLTHIVYVGRGGHDMAFSLSVIFAALAKGRQQYPQWFGKIRLYFIGTSYAPTNGEYTVRPIAEKFGVAKWVFEQPQRLPYFQALQVIADSQMCLIPGSDDAQYTASKLYPYILSQKPLLAVFHQQSSVVNILSETRAGHSVVFPNTDASQITALSDELLEMWQQKLAKIPFVPPTNWGKFTPFSAKGMTAAICQLFDQVIHS